MLKISTWNVNSIRQRLVLLLELLKKEKFDVLLLQELKCINDNFPFSEIRELGYYIEVHGQKAYNGVAIISKFPIKDVTRILPGDENDQQSRYIEGVISLSDSAIRVASIYVPNGQKVRSEAFSYKMKFFDRLYNHFKFLLSYEEVMLLGGDYNVAPEENDVYDSIKLDGTIGFHSEERGKFRALCNLGLYDAFRLVNDDKKEFSWWDYRGGGWQNNCGMRIDNMLISPQAADKLISCKIFSYIRGKEKTSDHAPLAVEVKI